MRKFFLSFILVFSFVFLLGFNSLAYTVGTTISGTFSAPNSSNLDSAFKCSGGSDVKSFSLIANNFNTSSYYRGLGFISLSPFTVTSGTVNHFIFDGYDFYFAFKGFQTVNTTSDLVSSSGCDYDFVRSLGLVWSSPILNSNSVGYYFDSNNTAIPYIYNYFYGTFVPDQNITDVGYFKNMQNYFKVLTETSSSGNQQIVKKRSLSFGWDGLTTTGITFDSDSLYNARFEADLYQKTLFGKGEFIKHSVIERSGSASSLYAIFTMEGLPAFQSGSLYESFKNDSGYNGDIVFTLNSVYFQPVVKVNNTLTSGGWTRIQINGDWSTLVTGGMSTDAVQGNINDGGSFTIDSSASGGGTGTGIASSGTTLDEALQNQNSTIQNLINNTNVDTTNLTQTLTNLVGEVRAVPHILSSVFSWLPPWCLQLVASIFGILFVIILLKVVIL